MKNIKLFLLFIIFGICISAYIFLHLDAYSINLGDTYYVIPADFMAILILSYCVIVSTVYLIFRNYINFRLGILSFLFTILPIIYMCWFNGFGEAISLYYSTIWTSENLKNEILVLFAIGNILFLINFFAAIFRLSKKNNSAVT